MTHFQEHVQRWQSCRLCALCDGRKSVVLYRGKLPCDVLFVGEAPGESEDASGFPFWGPAGLLLDSRGGQPPGIVQLAGLDDIDPLVRCGFTNIVACVPRDPDSNNKADAPLPEEVRACQPRLREIVEMARPRLLVAVGALARDWLVPRMKHALKTGIPTVDITHPAAILRANVAQRGLLKQRAVVVLRNAVAAMLEGETV